MGLCQKIQTLSALIQMKLQIRAKPLGWGDVESRDRPVARSFPLLAW